jgi:hypothetical protein
MEILVIESSHSLTTSVPEKRVDGAHSYHLNCRQFSTVQRSWQKNSITQEHALGVMTLNFERIWITPQEVSQVADAIKSARSPLALG